MLPGFGAKVLVLDDNQINLKLVTTVLRADGFAVRSASDAASALAAIREDPPALLFTDVQLPDIDGLELTRRLKANPATRQIVIVALTAFAMQSDREAAIAAGCDGFIPKPIDTRTLGAEAARQLAASTPLAAAA